MHLDRVTITGADDSINPEDLLPLSKDFPFVEWGILISKNSMGFRRFPGPPWLWTFLELANAHDMGVSLHVCGSWTRQILAGEMPQRVSTLIEGAQRLQLNFAGEEIPCYMELFRHALLKVSNQGKREFIFQIDGNRGRDYLSAADGADLACVPLFDGSGGKGRAPSEWPRPLKGYLYQGYAGGLGPHNLAEQLPLIGLAAGDVRFWVDMESMVRTPDDRFDLAKVRESLEICKAFVGK